MSAAINARNAARLSNGSASGTSSHRANDIPMTTDAATAGTAVQSVPGSCHRRVPHTTTNTKKTTSGLVGASGSTIQSPKNATSTTWTTTSQPGAKRAGIQTMASNARL